MITEDNTEDCLSIPIIDDNEDEGERECFAVSISTVITEGISLGINLATVCITDDDGSVHTVYFSIKVFACFECMYINILLSIVISKVPTNSNA